jgi:hypothetical protein
MPAINQNGTGQPTGGPSTAPNPANPAANLSALDRLVQMQDTMDSGNGSTTEIPDPAQPKVVANGTDPNRQPGGEGAVENLNGNIATERTDGTAAPLAEGEEVPANGEVTLPPALAAMDDGLQAEFLQLAEDVNAGLVNLGEIRRGHRLSTQFAEERWQLNDQITTLREQLAQGATNVPATSMPEVVARLKTPQDVTNRELQLRGVMRFCRKNPEGGEFGEGDQKQTYTREDISQMWDQAEDELALLPARRNQLESKASWSAKQTEAKRTALDLFPHLKDANNAETKQVNALVKAAPWIGDFFLSPHVAALTFIKGQAVMRAEAAKHKPGTHTNRAANGVALKRPASGGTQAGARGGTGKATVKDAIAQIDGGDRSVVSLAKLMDASGRG